MPKDPINKNAVQESSDKPTLVFVKRDAANKFLELIRNGYLVQKQSPNWDSSKNLISLNKISKELGMAQSTLQKFLKEKAYIDKLMWREIENKKRYYCTLEEAEKIKKDIDKNSVQPGEISLNQLAEKLRISDTTLKKFIIETFGKQKLTWRIFGTSGYYLSQETEDKISKILEGKIKQEGEVSISEIYTETGVTHRTLQKIILRELGEKAIKHRDFGGGCGGHCLSKENAEKIKKIVNNGKVQPEEISLRKVSEQLNISDVSLKEFIIKKFDSKTLTWREFGCVPGYFVQKNKVKKIQDAIANKRISKDEISIFELSKRVNISDQALKKFIIKKFNKNLLTWKSFGRHKPGYFISEENAKKIEGFINEKKAHESEISLYKLSKELGISNDGLKKFILRNFGKDSIKWREFGCVPGYFVQIALKEKIKEYLVDRKVKPNEVSIQKLCDDIQISPGPLKKFIIKEFGLGALNSRKFGGVPGYYLSSDLAVILREKINDVKQREGEISLSKLCKETGISSYLLKKIIIKTLGASQLKHREVGGSGIGEYLPNEDAQKIQEIVKQYISLKELTLELGIQSYHSIKFIEIHFPGTLERGIIGVASNNGERYLKKEIAEEIKIAFKSEFLGPLKRIEI